MASNVKEKRHEAKVLAALRRVRVEIRSFIGCVRPIDTSSSVLVARCRASLVLLSSTYSQVEAVNATVLPKEKVASRICLKPQAGVS